MKKTLALILTVILVVTSVSTAIISGSVAESTNLLASMKVDDWCDNTTSGYEGVDIVVDDASSESRHGGTAIKLTSGSAYRATHYRLPTLTAGTYTLKAEVKLGTTAPLEAFAVVGNASYSTPSASNTDPSGKQTDVKGGWQHLTAGTASDDGWVTYTKEITIAAGVTYDIYISCTSSCNGTVFSDFVLAAKEAVPVLVEGSGTVTTSPKYAFTGEAVTYTAKAGAGESFIGWYIDGEQVSTETTINGFAGIDTPTAKFTSTNLLGAKTASDWLGGNRSAVSANITENVTSAHGGYAFMSASVHYQGLRLPFSVEANKKYVLSFSAKSGSTWEAVSVLDIKGLSFDADGKNSAAYGAIDAKALTALNENVYTGTLATGETLETTANAKWTDVSIEFTPTANSTTYALYLAWAGNKGSTAVIISDICLKSLDAVPTYAEGNGAVKANPTAAMTGDEVILTANAYQEDTFDGWYIDDERVSTEATYKLSAFVDEVPTAKFTGTNLMGATTYADWESKTGNVVVTDATAESRYGGKNSIKLSGIYRGTHTTLDLEAGETYTLSFSYYLSDHTGHDDDSFQIYFGTNVVYGADGQQTNGTWIHAKSIKESDNLVLDKWTDYSFTFTATADSADIAIVPGWNTGFILSDFSLVKRVVQPPADGNYTIDNWKLAANKNVLENTEVVPAKDGGYAFMLKDYKYRGLHTFANVEAGQEYIISFATKSNMRYECIYIGETPTNAFNEDGKTPIDSTISLSSLNAKIPNTIDFSSVEWKTVSYSYIPKKSGTSCIAIFFTDTAASDGRAIISDFKVNKLEKYELAKSADDNLGFVEPSGLVEVFEGQEVTITANPLSENEFLGWYNDKGKRVSKDEAYTYTFNKDDVQTYTAKFKKGSLAIDNAGFENSVKETTLAWLDKETGELKQNDKNYLLDTVNRDSFSQSIQITKTAGETFKGNQSLKVFAGYSLAGYKIKGLEKNTTYTISYYANMKSSQASIKTFVTDAGLSPVVEFDETYQYYVEKVTPNALGKTSTNGTGDWQKISVSFNSGSSTDVILWWNYINGGHYYLIDNLSIVKTHYVNVIGGKGGNADASETGYVREGTKVTFTASALSGNTFKGWYITDTNKLYSKKTTFTETIKESLDIYAQFSGTNFPTREIFSERGQDGTFESGTISGWEARDPMYPYHNNTWCSWAVSENQAYQGTKSLRVNARIRNSVLPISNLNKNTKYLLSFYAYLPDMSDSDKIARIEHFAVVNTECDSLKGAAKVYARTYGIIDGGSGWHKVNLYFTTEDITDVAFLAYYAAPNSAAQDGSQYMYLDNMSLTEYASYDDVQNGDFSDGTDYWQGNGVSTNDGLFNKVLKLENSGDTAYQIVNAGTDKRVVVKFRAKGNIYAAASALEAVNPTISNAISSLSYIKTSGDEIDEYEFEVYTAANPDIKLTFKAESADAMIDDVQIIIKDSSTGGVLENIDFETERFDVKNSDPRLWSIYEASGSNDSNVHSGDKSLHLSYDPNREKISENLFADITAYDFTFGASHSAQNNTEVVTSKNGGHAFMLKNHSWQGLYLPFEVKGGEEYTLSFSIKGNTHVEAVVISNRSDLNFRDHDAKTPVFSELNSTVPVNKINEKLHTSGDLSGAEWYDVTYTFVPNKTGTHYFALAFGNQPESARTIVSDLTLIKKEEKPDSNLFNEAYMSYNSPLGVSYKISLYYKIVSGKNIRITPEKSGAICKEVGLDHTAKGSGWQKLEFIFPNADYTNLRTYIANIATKAKCEVYIDDIKIEVVDPLILKEHIKDSYSEMIYNLIENGAFEDEIGKNNFKDLPKTCELIEDENSASSGRGFLTVSADTRYVLPIKVKDRQVYNFGVTMRANSSAKGFVGIANSISPVESYYSNTDFEIASQIPVTNTNGKWQRDGFKIITGTSGYVYLVVECTKGEFDIDTLMLFEEDYALEKDVNDYSLDVVYDFDDLNSANCIYNGGYEDEQNADSNSEEENNQTDNEQDNEQSDTQSGSPDTSDKGLPIAVLLITLSALLVVVLLSKRKVIDMLTKGNVTKMLCLLLSVTISLSLLGGCKKKPAQNSSSQPTSSQEEITSSDTESEVESEEETVFEDTEDYQDFEDFEDTESTDDTESEEPQEPTDDYYDEFDQNNVKFEIYNSQEPINTEYRGVSGSIYHAFGFMEDQFDGRVYNDKMMDLELDRLVDSGIKYTRTRYDSRWAWDSTAGKYDWKKNRFQYFLNYAEELQSRGVNIGLQISWEFKALVYNQKYTTNNTQLGEVPYLCGVGSDVYGENKGVDFTGKTEEETRLIKAANRMGYWIAETLRQAKAQRGINNISHLWYFVEASGNSIYEKNNMAGEEAEEYLLVCRTIKDKLEEEGVASWAKHVGPNQGFADQGANLINYVMTRDPDLFDIWTAHAYPKPENVLNNVYYDLYKPVCDTNIGYLMDAGTYETSEFWFDELNTGAVGLTQKDGSSWLGLQQVVAYLAAQHTGVDNISIWQIFDQLFTDNLAPDGGEFFEGIHMCGTAPSLFKSSIPRPQYYFTSLFSKYHGYQNGKVFQTNNDFAMLFADVYVGAVELENGDYTITVVNVGVDDVNFEVLFDKAINKNLYRHRVNANSIEPTTKAQLAPADATFVDVKDKFKDVIHGGDMIIYTSVKG